MAIVALLLLVVFAGCSDRERRNPLDPANPNTAGRPSGFKAVALSGQVILSWAGAPGVSTQLFRRADGEADYTAITAVLPPGVVLHTDINAPNGVTYHYRLHYVTSQGLSGTAATAEATPSPVIAWTIDSNFGALLRLGADGREFATRQDDFGRPVYLAVDRARDLVWVVDFEFGRVLIYNPSLGTRVSVGSFFYPQVVAIDPVDGSGWISDYTNNEVRHVLASGSPGTPQSIPNLNRPIGVAVDPRTRQLWICERDGHRVLRRNADGAAAGQVGFTAPSRVAIDSANGEAWITSFTSGRLLHVGTDMGTLHDITSLRGPVGVAVDHRRGRIWVADPSASEVVAFRRDGTEEFRVGGLTEAVDLAVELGSGEAWVVMRGTIARVSATGNVLVTTRGLSAPAAIGLDRLN